MNGSFRPEGRTNDLVMQDLASETVIYDLSNNKAFCLNETSARVWRLCNGIRTVDDIAASIGSEEIVWLALDQLSRENLLEKKSVPTDILPEISRRDVIRRVGLASLIALPVIASVVSPQSVFVQTSLLPLGSI